MKVLAASAASFVCALTFAATVAKAECRWESGEIICETEAPSDTLGSSPVDPGPTRAPSDSGPPTGGGSITDFGGGANGGADGGAAGGFGGAVGGPGGAGDGFGGAVGGPGGADGGFGDSEATAGQPAGNAAEPYSSRRVKASRSFFGPNQYPPEGFAAYGIVAFPARATIDNVDRYVNVCRAYWATLDPPAELDLPIYEQMVTVWPITTDKIADELNADASTEPTALCADAVKNYSLKAGKEALKDAKFASEVTDPEALWGRGPFLLAWSPSTERGKKETLVLAFNLSHLSAYEDILKVFRVWSDEIEKNQELWPRVTAKERYLSRVRSIANRLGNTVVSVIGIVGGN